MYRVFLLPLVFSMVACGGGSSGGGNKAPAPSTISSSSPTTIISSSRSSSLTTAKATDVKEITSNFGAYAALLNNGNVITWGHVESGGETRSISNDLTNVVKIYATQFAFAALKRDGTVVTWGDKDYGGDASSVQSELNDVVSISASTTRFAAIKKDSTAVIWGWYIDSIPANNNFTNIKEITFVEGNNLIIALKKDNSLQFLKTPQDDVPINTEFTSIIDAERVVTTSYSFSIIKKDGGIVYSNHDWGDHFQQPQQYQSILNIYQSDYDYVALKNDGTVFEWGMKYFTSGSNEIASTLTNVKKIIPGMRSFVALKNDGTIENWGDCHTYDKGQQPAHELAPKDLHMVIDVVGVKRSGFGETCTYAALRSDGTVHTWGSSDYGGDSESVQPYLTNVKKIIATSRAFAALKEDNTVVYWGSNSNEYGKDVQIELKNVKDIYSTDVSFAATRDDGSIFTWGEFVDDGVVSR